MATIAAVAASDCVTTISRAFAARFAEPLGLVLRPPPLPDALDVTMVGLRLRAADRALQWFRGVLREEAAAVYGEGGAGRSDRRPRSWRAPRPRLQCRPVIHSEQRLNVIVYAIPVFIALMAVEFGIGVMTGRNVYRLNDAVGSLAAGILSQISGDVPAGAERGDLHPGL